MFRGKRFVLKTAALAIETTDGSSVAVFIPAGEFVEVISEPRLEDSRTVEVRLE